MQKHHLIRACTVVAGTLLAGNAAAQQSCVIDQAALATRARPFVELQAILNDAERGAEHCAAAAEVFLLARTGNAAALMSQGDILSSGALVAADVDGAILAYTGAYQAGRSEALVKLGDIYWTERDDRGAAARYFQMAVDAGDLEGAERLGDLTADAEAPNWLVALEYYQRAVSDGSTSAMLKAAAILSDDGRGLADLPRAIALYEQALAQGSMPAARALGVLYSGGSPAVTADGARATGYLQQAADAGDRAAWLRLGDIYGQGTLVPADPDKAVASYEQALALGDTTAAIRLGEIYVGRGEGEPAVRYYTIAAEAERSGVQRRLGDLFRAGEFVTADGARAVDHYLKALAEGDLTAAQRLGDVYREGLVVAADGELARQYYQQAVEGGDERSMFRLAEMLREGRQIPQDLAEAKRLYTAALAADVPRSALRLGEVAVIEGDGATATGFFQQAIVDGDSVALIRLGDLARDGQLVPADAVQAAQFYEQAQPLRARQFQPVDRPAVGIEDGDQRHIAGRGAGRASAAEAGPVRLGQAAQADARGGAIGPLLGRDHSPPRRR